MEAILTQTQFNRIEKLAFDAGRSVKQVMPHILNHGLPELERVVKGVKRGIADADAGHTSPHAKVMQEIDALFAKYDKKAA